MTIGMGQSDLSPCSAWDTILTGGLCNLMNPPAVLSQSPASAASGGGSGGDGGSPTTNTSTWVMVAIIATLGFVVFAAVKT
jgi:hypothetical protein